MPEKEYLSQEKYDELVKELDHLKTVRRQEVAEELEYARSLGDLSENAEYQEARDEQGKVEDRIAKIESIMKLAVIVAPHHSEVVEVGSVVTVKKVGDTKDRTFTIVGPEETDSAAGKVSYQSPIGQAMLGKKKGDEFTFLAPAGEVTYKVVSIK
jgi:transcription elongation factor GreA